MTAEEFREFERAREVIRCHEHLRIANSHRLEGDQMTMARAVIWCDWLEPFEIPTDDLYPSFILGNTIRGDHPFGVTDAGRGYQELVRRRARRPKNDGVRQLADRLAAGCLRCLGSNMEMCLSASGEEQGVKRGCAHLPPSPEELPHFLRDPVRAVQHRLNEMTGH